MALHQRHRRDHPSGDVAQCGDIENLAERLGASIGALLNALFLNAELIIALVALRAGLMTLFRPASRVGDGQSAGSRPVDGCRRHRSS